MSYILEALKRSEQDRHQQKVATISNDMMMLPKARKQHSLLPYIIVLVLLINGLGIFYYAHVSSQSAVAENDKSALSQMDASATSVSYESSHQNEVRVVNSAPLAPQSAIAPSVSPNTSAQMTKPLPESFIAKPSEASHSDYSSKRSAPVVPRNKETMNTQPGAPHTAQANTHYDRPISNVAAQASVRGHGDSVEHVEFTRIDPKSEARRPPAPQSFQSVEEEVVKSSFDFSVVPHLTDLSLSFQRSIPDIVFSSHIYSEQASARRALLNNLYLREGDEFSGLRINEIGEFYIAFDKQGTQFKLPVLRDWSAP